MSVPNLQVVVVCGKNEALKQDLLSLQKQNSDALKVFGYVENIDELFRVTSCMITKPGGITLSEAAALQVPVILYKPVPGQENENAMYFERKGATVVIRDDSEVFAKTEALLQDDVKLLQMKEAMKSIYLPEPAGHIVDAILAENHAEPRHIPIKSPALAQSFT